MCGTSPTGHMFPCRDVWAHLRNHCVPCTAIGGRVLHGDSVQLQGELVLAPVSRDRDEALEGQVIPRAIIIDYVTHPLWVLSWGLTDPAPVISTGCDGESRDFR